MSHTPLEEVGAMFQCHANAPLVDQTILKAFAPQLSAIQSTKLLLKSWQMSSVVQIVIP